MNFKNPNFLILAVVVALSTGTGLKVYLSAKSELRTAEIFLAQKDFISAATYFERPIRWHMPLPGFQDRAARGMWTTAQNLESANDVENALNAYRSLRGAFFSLRSIVTLGKEWIDRCNEKIAYLMARKSSPSPDDSLEKKKSDILQLLKVEKPPSLPWSIMGEIGFFGWTLCAFMFIASSITKTGQLKFKQAGIWSGGFLIFYFLWVAGLANT